MDDARLRQRIQQIAESVKNVRFEDLVTLLDNHIEHYCEANELRYDHRNSGGSHHAFVLGKARLILVKPHGTPLLKRVYVESFLDAMEKINLYP